MEQAKVLTVNADCGCRVEKLRESLIRLLECNIVPEYLLYREDVLNITDFACEIYKKNITRRC